LTEPFLRCTLQHWRRRQSARRTHHGASGTQFEAKITGGEAAAPARATPRVVVQVPWRAVRSALVRFFLFLKVAHTRAANPLRTSSVWCN